MLAVSSMPVSGLSMAGFGLEHMDDGAQIPKTSACARAIGDA